MQPGDVVDFALAPTGLRSAPDDDFDGAYLTAAIETEGGLETQIDSDIESIMRNSNSTVYLRIPFNLAEPASIRFLTLRMKYDDGFVAYLNGSEVARGNAPRIPAWHSRSLEGRASEDAVRFEEFDLSDQLDLLNVGDNLIAIHGLNSNVSDSDFLLFPELTSATSAIDLLGQRYFSLPTPGSVNGVGRQNLAPFVVDISHSPEIAVDETDLLVTCRAIETAKPVSAVTLNYRVMFNEERALRMRDDGLHDDGMSGDGVYGATIPGAAFTAGQMIRYFITVRDSDANASRWPLFQDRGNSPEYFGTMARDPTVNTALPVLYWFIENSRRADSENGARSSVYFDGVFYDNINIPATINFLAAMIITGGVDCCHKNYYAYRDSEGTGEWQYLPWDVDLTFGRNWTSSKTYYDDAVYTANSLFVGSNNALVSTLFSIKSIRQMYLRRIRTLMDELLQAPDTPADELRYENRIREIEAVIEPDATLNFRSGPPGEKRKRSQMPSRFLRISIFQLDEGFFILNVKFLPRNGLVRSFGSRNSTSTPNRETRRKNSSASPTPTPLQSI